MAGYLKKGASTWSTAVPSIYVKTGANTWSAATSAWVKINGLNDSTSWKQWFTGSVIDSFTRTTSPGSLGSADLGGTWFNATIAGATANWYANGSTAFNSDSQGSGTTISAWSSIEVGSNNSFAEVATSAGVGPMIWANYSGAVPTTWWAAIPYKIETATPYEYQGNCVCNSTSTCNTCQTAAGCGSTSTPFSYDPTPVYVYQGSISVTGTDYGTPTLSTTVYQGSVATGGSYAGSAGPATASTPATCQSYSACGGGYTLIGSGCYTGGGTTCSPAGVGCTTNGASYSTTVNTGVKTCNATYGTGVVNSTGQATCNYTTTGGSSTDGGCETGTSGYWRGCKGYTTSTSSGTCSCTTSASQYIFAASCATYGGCTSPYSYPGSGSNCTYTVYNDCTAYSGSSYNSSLQGCYYPSSTGCAGSYTGSPAGTACSYSIPNSACAQGTLSGGRCYGPSTTGCAGSYTGSPAGTSCAYFSSWSCPSGGTRNASTGKCEGTTVTANTCASCAYCGTTTVGGGTYPNCSASGFTCQTLIGYTYSYSYGIKIIQGSGSAYTVISDTATSAFAAVVRASTSGNTLTINAWSDTAKSNQVATNIVATNSGTKGTKCGIVRAYSQYQQGNTADNFSAGVI